MKRTMAAVDSGTDPFDWSKAKVKYLINSKWGFNLKKREGEKRMMDLNLEDWMQVDFPKQNPSRSGEFYNFIDPEKGN